MLPGQDQNDSVPLDAIMCTWCSGVCVKEQLPSGLRGNSPWALTVPVELLVASVNWLVPPVISRFAAASA